MESINSTDNQWSSHNDDYDDYHYMFRHIPIMNDMADLFPLRMMMLLLLLLVVVYEYLCTTPKRNMDDISLEHILAFDSV